jgi:hypothetical protein
VPHRTIVHWLLTMTSPTLAATQRVHQVGGDIDQPAG